jgi:hypothetical protein
VAFYAQSTDEEVKVDDAGSEKVMICCAAREGFWDEYAEGIYEGKFNDT